MSSLRPRFAPFCKAWSWIPVVSLVLALFAFSTAWAQDDEDEDQGTQPPIGSQVQAPGTAAPDYKIGNGDVLKVDVFGRADLSGRYTVTEDGSVAMPVVGTVKAVGRTAANLATEISRRVSLVSREIPRVVVTVLEFRSRKVYVLGSVVLPGAYPFPQDPTVWEAIAKAGGPTENADMTAVEIIPGDVTSGRQVVVINLAAAIREGRVGSLPRLRPEDTVRVPWSTTAGGAAAGEFYMFGAVAAQGPRSLRESADLLSAIVGNGGPASTANLKKVQLVRRSGSGTVSISVNLQDYMNHANANGNPTLKPGDTVYIPYKPRGLSPLAVLGVMSTVLGLTTSIIALTN